MDYSIVPPDNVVEASLSDEPDDISVASIRIEATAVTTPLADLDYVTFTVPSQLTTNPRAITAQAGNFREWTMTSEGDGRFRATPIGTPTASPWTFHLRDIEVAKGVGIAEIGVEETPSRQPPIDGLEVRKVDPSLRIDEFRAVVSESNREPLAPTTTSGGTVRLNWATTAATTVSVWDPSGRKLYRKGGDDVWRVPPVPPSKLPNGVTEGGATYWDHSVAVEVDTTGTYTLVASNAESHAVAQVTVTVTDKIKAVDIDATGLVKGKTLTSTGEVKGGSVTATGVVKGETLTATGEVKGQSVSATGELRGSSVTAENGGTITAGTVSADTVKLEDPDNTRGKQRMLTVEGHADVKILHSPQVYGKQLFLGSDAETGDSAQVRMAKQGNGVWFLEIGYSRYQGRTMATLGANGWEGPSDVVLKDDVRDLDSSVECVRSLRPVQFRWKGSGAPGLGFIAQEVEEVFPHLVSTDAETGLKSLSYNSFGVLAIAAIQQLEADHAAKINGLESRLQQMEEQLSQLLPEDPP